VLSSTLCGAVVNPHLDVFADYLVNECYDNLYSILKFALTVSIAPLCLPGITPMKPGSCALPFYGIDFAIVNPVVRAIV
jgi:hypothetical protein